MNMINEVRRYMLRHRMAEPYEPLWVAVSGGVDSMVLLHMLRALDHPVNVVHVDHGSRGAESDADRGFVKDHCQRLGIECHIEKVDVVQRSEETGSSMQMAARQLRYGVFHKVLGNGYHKMALAHHQDDAIETLFIHLLRGMGAKGWRTIPPVSGPFIRPLMRSTRVEILSYAEAHGVQFREDKSNNDPKYLRNKIRHELIPILEKWRPGARRTLDRNIELFREMDVIVMEHVRSILSRTEISSDGERRIGIPLILSSGSPLLILHHLLRGHGLHPDRIADLLQAMRDDRIGSTFYGDGIKVLVDRDILMITSDVGPVSEYIITGLDRLPSDLPVSLAEVTFKEMDTSAGYKVAWLDHGSLKFPLILRPWRSGDRLRPIGLNGSKLVSDMLIDAKVSRWEKERTYVLESGGEIIWLVGHRIAAGYQAQMGRPVLRMEWIGFGSMA